MDPEWMYQSEVDGLNVLRKDCFAENAGVVVEHEEKLCN